MFSRWVWVLGTIAAACVVIAGASARTAPTAVPKFDMSTHAGVVKYLKGHGIDPKGVVVQRGSHNYAGPIPGCLSARWTCTTAKHVVQIMAPNAPSSANQYVCTASDGSGAPNECLIVQSSSGTDNNATCAEKIGDPTGTQHCAIYQLNTTGANNAYVRQQVSAVTGLTQVATQATEIAQWNTSGSNTAQVNQDLTESTTAVAGKTGMITQTQDGHQTVAVSQHSDTGNNAAQVNQSLQLKASATGGTSITQNQDTDPSLGPNTQAAIYQNADEDVSAPTSTGTNDAYILQSNDLNASGSKTTNLSQQQGDPATGLLSHVVQASTGVSTTKENQNEHQNVLASQVTNSPLQVQYGPMWNGSPQGNNPADSFTLSQSSDQNASPASPNQFDAEYSNCEVIGGGTCTSTQKISNDKQNATNTCSDSSCNISLTASSSTSEGGGVHPCSGDCSNGGEAPPPTQPDICTQIENAPGCSELSETSTTVSQTSDTTAAGCPVTFTAEVYPYYATGTVTFYDGSTPLSTQPTDDGVASFGTTSLGIGSHTITAVYSGDSTYATSTSPSITHVVLDTSCIG